MMTIHEVSKLAGVSVRTLHHYDAIGLLPPTTLTEAGYRLYDDTALARLQSILLFDSVLHLFVWASKVFTTKSASKKSTGKPHQLNEAVNKNIQRRHDQASCLLRYPRLS